MTKPVEETTLKLIADALRSYSQILETMAEIEETAKKTFDVLKEVFNPDRLAEMRNRLPPDLYAEFAASLFKLASVAPKLQNPLALTTEEKKKISDDMLKIAETITKISKISI
ncbi:MAG: hypothetical protein RQ839_08385 [Thermoproteus sp.]|nr:hypothetical protein [Thermoproteus sp.]MDT7882363.1 hypothetical protein [Thermoproteus sp.]